MTMANSCVIVLARLCSVFSFACLALIGSFLTTIGSINGANGTKIILQLIHRDSILPAFSIVAISNNKNLAINSSQARQAYSHSKSDDSRGPLIPDNRGTIFLVNVSIGEPPFPQLVAMDTGSSLTWVKRQHPLDNHLVYDPINSSTYTKLSCDFRHQFKCLEYSRNSQCRKESQCVYNIRYVQSGSSGILAFDKFTFVTSTGGISEVPDLLFGFGLKSYGNVADLGGVLGLQFINQHSIVSRVGKKFSYCIGNISDPYYPYNQLVLGEGAIMEGDTTPMLINKQGRYVVSLEGISVGEKQLEINQREFEFNFVIDSGYTQTLLLRSAFEPLKEEVMGLLDGLLQPVEDYDYESPCYRGNLVRDLKGFPTVTLHLAGGTDLSLDVEGMFRRVTDNLFCMAVSLSTDETSIIGITAQQYYNIGFDLNELKVSFLSIECELLED